MTIQYVIDEALNLADEKGNETEYKEKIIRAINHVQAKISKFAKPIKKYVNIETENEIITLPEDFLSLVEITDANGDVLIFDKIDTNKVKMESDGVYRVCYNTLLTDIIWNDENEVDTSMELGIEKVAEQCLIYGVAAEICMDNEELYPILQKEYNNLLANLGVMVDIPNTGSSISHIKGWWY
jgi:hypothetical protein